MHELLDAAVQLIQLMALLALIALNLNMRARLKAIEDKLNR